MSEIRSEILNTGIAELKSARIVINAPAAKIFDIIARPARASIGDPIDYPSGPNLV
ncbi:MAG: hypothetical protein RIT18_224 [Actinomycetota bacterium]